MKPPTNKLTKKIRLCKTQQKKEQSADDKVQLSQKEQPTENKVQNEEKEPVQSVVEQPEEEPVEKENEPSVSGGEPAPPLTFDSGDILGEFKTWIQTVPLMPEDVVPGSDEYYYYLKPELQEMLIDDRYYLLPDTPNEYALCAIMVSARDISFGYTNEDGYIIEFSYRTDQELLPDTISSSKQQFVKYGDVQYLQEYAGLLDGSTSLTLQRNFDKYTIRINCEHIDYL